MASVMSADLVAVTIDPSLIAVDAFWKAHAPN